MMTKNEKAVERARLWRESHRELSAEYQRNYHKLHRDEHNAACKKYRDNPLNKGKIRNAILAWEKHNPGKVKERHNRYLDSHPEKAKEFNRRSSHKARSTPRGKLLCNVKTKIAGCLKGSKNKRQWESLVGYNLKDLKEHLEKKFTPEMNWDNYGSYWHLDHIIPIAAFNFTTPEDIDFKKCWALENLQPLKAIDNIKKKDHVEIPFQPSLALAVAVTAADRLGEA